MKKVAVGIIALAALAAGIGIAISIPRAPDPGDSPYREIPEDGASNPRTHAATRATRPSQPSTATSRPVVVFANTRCPIMGQKIRPTRVTPDLTRTYKGKTIAFCCEGCAPLWEAMDEAQKDAKLEAAR